MNGLLKQFKRFRKGDQGLEKDIDYLYCEACGVHVPCRRIPSGGWEVQCSGCIGECLLCDCHLRRFCFGSRDQFPPVHEENQDGE